MILKFIIRIAVIIGIAALVYFLVTGKDAAEIIAPQGGTEPVEEEATSTNIFSDLFGEDGIFRKLIDRFSSGEGDNTE